MVDLVLALLSPVPDAALAVWIFFAPAAMVGAYGKRRSVIAWLGLALLGGPFAMLVLACLGPAGIPCHQCQEHISPRARECGFCGVPRFERRSRRDVAFDWIAVQISGDATRQPLDLRAVVAVAAAAVLCTAALLSTAAELAPVVPVSSPQPALRVVTPRKPFQLQIVAEARPRAKDPRLREQMDRACTSSVLAALARVFPEREVRRFPDGQPAGGHVVASTPSWDAAGRSNREAAVRTASLCIFGGRGFEVRDEQTGRSLAEWSQLAGYVVLDGS